MLAEERDVKATSNRTISRCPDIAGSEVHLLLRDRVDRRRVVGQVGEELLESRPRPGRADRVAVVVEQVKIDGAELLRVPRRRLLMRLRPIRVQRRRDVPVLHTTQLIRYCARRGTRCACAARAGAATGPSIATLPEQSALHQRA